MAKKPRVDMAKDMPQIAKDSPVKSNLLDPGGFFEKKKPIKPIVQTKEQSAFKMKGYPSHSTSSPMKHTTGRVHTHRHGGSGSYDKNTGKQTGVYGSKSKGGDKKTSVESKVFSNSIKDLGKTVGADLVKAAAVTAVGKLFEEKKKETTRIIPDRWGNIA
jgi:hypothetical protein